MDPMDQMPAAPPPGMPMPPEMQSQEQEPPPAEVPEEAIDQINILPLLLRKKKDWIEKEAKRVVTDTAADEESRKEFMETIAAQLKLFAGILKTLGYPAQGGKAPHLSIMAKAILHLWARVFDQIIPAKGDILHASSPAHPESIDRIQAVERHFNWQLRSKIPEWSSSHQVSIMSWLTSGSMFRVHRYDPIERTQRIDYVPLDDIILPYTEIDIHPLMKSLSRITRVLRLERWEMEAYEDAEMFSNLEEVFPEDEESSSDGDSQPTRPNDKDSPIKDAVEEIEGVKRPERVERDAKREVLFQNKRLRFPKGLDIEGLDGETKPVTIAVDRQTKKPVAVMIREEPDPVDQARFAAQAKAYEIALKNSAATVLPPGAPPPKAPKKPRPVAMKTIYNVVHYRLFPNPHGIYGLGVGYLLQGSNELANELAAEYMLAAKFANMKTGFMARGTKEKRGDVQLQMGKIMETDLEPEVLDKGIKMLDFGAPSEGLMKVVQKLEENAEIAANADILSGEKGASNETAKGMMVRNSNALALISVITRLYLEPMKYEVKLLAHGNSIFMDETEAFPYTEQSAGEPGKTQTKMMTVRREDYVEDLDIEFTADARMSSKPERIGDAKDFVGLVLNSPMAQNALLVDFCFRKLFRAAESPDYEAAMGPPPSPPPPPSPESQEVENAGFFNEKDHPVLPDDNHMEHLHKIDELLAGPLAQDLSSTGKQMLDRHKRAHIAAYYLQLQALQKETGVNINAMADAGGMGGMDGGSAGPEVPEDGGGPPGGGMEAPQDAGPPGGF